MSGYFGQTYLGFVEPPVGHPEIAWLCLHGQVKFPRSQIHQSAAAVGFSRYIYNVTGLYSGLHGATIHSLNEHPYGVKQ